MCIGYEDCSLAGYSECGVHEVELNTNEILGDCSYCNVCKVGGIDADCTNIGYQKFNCYFPEDE